MCDFIVQSADRSFGWLGNGYNIRPVYRCSFERNDTCSVPMKFAVIPHGEMGINVNEMSKGSV